jgi:hypothetical protein
MRTVVGTFICLTALACVAFAAPETNAPLPTYHLHGYYKLRDRSAIWQLSDRSPWQVVKDEPWIEPRVVKWGYVPIVHNSQRYYCLIDDRPITGSNIARTTFLCGDAATVQFNYNNGWRPSLSLYGADAYYSY